MTNAQIIFVIALIAAPLIYAFAYHRGKTALIRRQRKEDREEERLRMLVAKRASREARESR